MFDYIKEFLKANEVDFSENKSLKELSAVRIGGKAAIVAYPEDEAQFVDVISFLADIGADYVVLGRMSNVLPRDEDYSGVVIRTDKLSELSIRDNTITASVGVMLPFLARRAIAADIAGFEELSGIPGSVGGAVAGNAGAFGRECSELVSEACIFDPRDRRCYKVKGDKLDFGYRSSMLKKANCFVLSVKFEGFASDRFLLKLRELELLSKRKATQPHGLPSLGSVFKRTKDGVSAGYLIDKCGLKGYRAGDAQISETHAGFIVNLGKATARDYIACMETAAFGVRERFGIELEREIRLL